MKPIIFPVVENYRNKSFIKSKRKEKKTNNRNSCIDWLVKVFTLGLLVEKFLWKEFSVYVFSKTSDIGCITKDRKLLKATRYTNYFYLDIHHKFARKSQVVNISASFADWNWEFGFTLLKKFWIQSFSCRCFPVFINPFLDNVFILYTLKIPENLWFLNFSGGIKWEHWLGIKLRITENTT